MTVKRRPESRRPTAERAALWLLTLQSEELPAVQRAELIDWLRESPLHISELLRASRLQRDLAHFDGWQQVAPMADPEVSRLVTLLEVSGDTARRRSLRRRLCNTALVAASVAALCVFGAWAFGRLDRTVLATQLGERSETTLADGSVVNLAPDSEVVVRYHTHERLLTLDRGEALFHVARNSERPFIVQAAQTRVRAVGTVFNVERGDQGVSVTVVEGRVTVSQQRAPRIADSGAGPAAMPLLLDADEQVSISLMGRATAVHKVRSTAVASWTSGQLAFDNETIAQIAHRFNLYNKTQIRVIDAQLAARRLSGVFRANDPESFVAFVEAVTDTHSAQRNADVITLGRPAKSNGGGQQ